MWTTPIAWTVAAILLAIAVLHVYWALGGRWPGHDEESLARTVVGGGAGMRMPPPAASVGVAVALTIAAALVTGIARRFGLPSPIVRVGALGAAGVLLARGAYGFVDAHVRPAIRESRYARLNVVVYSPLCIALGGASLFVVLGS